MYHMRLIKGLSYDGHGIHATSSSPDVYTEDEGKYRCALESGYFAKVEGTEGESESELEDDQDQGEFYIGVEPDNKNEFDDMTVAELRKYADTMGIELAGASKKSDIMSCIKAAEEKAAEARAILKSEQE